MPKYRMTIKKIKYDDLSELMVILLYVFNVFIYRCLFVFFLFYIYFSDYYKLHISIITQDTNKKIFNNNLIKL